MADIARRKQVRVLAIHRYFWPDTSPYASILRTITSHWVAEGYSVDVLSTQPSYKPGVKIGTRRWEEVLDGVRVCRIPLLRESGREFLRLLNILLFGLGIITFVIRRRYDVIMVSTAPPVLAGASTRFAARLTRARLVYHCMDIHPEIGRISGEFSRSMIFNQLLRVDSKTCRQSTFVIVLSDDMAQSLRNRSGCEHCRIRVIRNFDLPFYGSDSSCAGPIEYSKGDNMFRVVFAGNMGRFQGLETAVEAMHLLRDCANIEMVFMGEGKVLATLKQLADGIYGTRIKFFSHQPVDIARAVIRSADLGLVSLAPKIYQYAFPSKLVTYLRLGTPILAAVEEESRIAKMIRLSSVGTTVSPGDALTMAATIRMIAESPELKARYSRNASLTAKNYFDVDEILRQWSELLIDVLDIAD